jgi:hypothetical protein
MPSRMLLRTRRSWPAGSLLVGELRIEGVSADSVALEVWWGDEPEATGAATLTEIIDQSVIVDPAGLALADVDREVVTDLALLPGEWRARVYVDHPGAARSLLVLLYPRRELHVGDHSLRPADARSLELLLTFLEDAIHLHRIDERVTAELRGRLDVGGHEGSNDQDVREALSGLNHRVRYALRQYLREQSGQEYRPAGSAR